MPEPYKEELSQAEECLSDAKIMLNTEVSDQAVASRLYYACYYAPKAILYYKGFKPKGHGGLVSLFGKEVMGEGTVTKEDAKFLSRSQSRREQADYENTPVEEDLRELLEKTENFVTKIKQIVEENR